MALAASPSKTDSTTTYEEISMWKVTALKEYLKVRDLPHSKKSKAELISLVYGAMHLGYQPVKSAVEKEAQRKKEYLDLLKIDESTVILDPLTITDWNEEQHSMSKWPKVLFSDLVMYVNEANTALSAEMYSRYKQGKAYAYFADDWVSSIKYYHEPASEVSYFKTVCRPSERISAVPHTIWIACLQVTGKILSAWCSCTAG